MSAWTLAALSLISIAAVRIASRFESHGNGGG